MRLEKRRMLGGLGRGSGREERVSAGDAMGAKGREEGFKGPAPLFPLVCRQADSASVWGGGESWGGGVMFALYIRARLCRCARAYIRKKERAHRFNGGYHLSMTSAAK